MGDGINDAGEHARARDSMMRRREDLREARTGEAGPASSAFRRAWLAVGLKKNHDTVVGHPVGALLLFIWTMEQTDITV